MNATDNNNDCADVVAQPIAKNLNSVARCDNVSAWDISKIDYAIFLQLYLCAVVLSNLCLLFFDGHGGDLGFWQNWVDQLATKGYEDFNGNYPPMFIHWLYLLGQFYDLLAMPIENNLFLKFLSQIPVLVSHLLVTVIIFTLLKKYAQNKVHFHYGMLLTALNPAILFNGPIWGQVDITPLVPLLLAILLSFHSRLGFLSLPFYCLALLTKFQMIAFAPVFGIIFFRNMKVHLLGAGLSVLVFILAFLPSIISGSFVDAFKFAYVNVVQLYGLTTMGASNIWILLTGNAAPDHLMLFGVAPDSLFAIPFTAKYFGMISFSLVCAAVFLRGIYKVIHPQPWISTERHMSITLFYAMVCATAFFTLLPAMHERYLLPAVVVSLAYYAVTPNKIIYPLGLTFISAFNLAMTLGLKTSTLWPAISWIALGLLIYCVLELVFERRWTRYIKQLAFRLASIKLFSLWISLISISYVGYFVYQSSLIHAPELKPNEILLTYIPPISAQQDYGTLKTNQSVHGNVLSVGGKRYRYGLGTHTNSTIEYQVPKNSSTFSFIAGIDDEVESANVKFIVMGDGKLLWESQTQYGFEKDLPVISLDIKNIDRLTLVATSERSINSGHADWVNPIITLTTPTNPNE